MRRAWFFFALSSLSAAGAIAACNGDDNTGPAPNDAGSDTSAIDAARADGASPLDASAADASTPDTSVADANAPDTNAPDTSAPDANASDANTPDTSIADANAPDTNVPDTSVPVDSGIDAGPTCAPGAGTVVSADWSFAVSADTLNGGKGQLLTVNRCDSVQWTNKDSAPHSVINQPGASFTFSTSTNTGGAYAPIRFDRAGTFDYECGVHGLMMVGEITVNP
jgi:plastocyanin